MAKKRERKETISHFDVTLISDVFDGQIMDTEVRIDDTTIFWIAGPEIDNFLIEFRALVDKFAI